MGYLLSDGGIDGSGLSYASNKPNGYENITIEEFQNGVLNQNINYEVY